MRIGFFWGSIQAARAVSRFAFGLLARRLAAPTSCILPVDVHHKHPLYQVFMYLLELLQAGLASRPCDSSGYDVFFSISSV